MDGTTEKLDDSMRENKKETQSGISLRETSLASREKIDVGSAPDTCLTYQFIKVFYIILSTWRMIIYSFEMYISDNRFWETFANPLSRALFRVTTRA